VQFGNDAVFKLCWRADPLHRGVELSIPSSDKTPVACLRAHAGAEQLGYVDVSDTATRSTLEVDARMSRPAFVVGWKAGKAPARADSGWRFGFVHVPETKPPSFNDVMAEVRNDLRIEIYEEACETLCPERQGNYSVLVSATSTPTAHENTSRVECGTFDLRASNRPPAAGQGAASGSAGTGNVTEAVGGGAGDGGAGGGGAGDGGAGGS
jgi:hypothetical protein